MKIIKTPNLNDNSYQLKCKNYMCNAEFEFEGWELKQELNGNYYDYFFTCFFCKTENKYSQGLLGQYRVKKGIEKIKEIHKKQNKKGNRFEQNG
jgi:hypothetical protein